MTSTPHNQDGGDLLDFADAVNAGRNPQPTNDLQRTYLHVQHALQGDSAAIPPTTKQSTWENVMSTVSMTPAAPVSNRTRKKNGIQSPLPRAFKPKRLQWTPLASIAAAALVVIASFGFWITSGGDTPPSPESRQVAGLAPGELLQLATPAPKHACDFTQDMPIYAAESGVPTGGTTLVWEKGGNLYMHCNEEPEGILLASDVNDAGPVEGIPGLLQYTPVSETDASVTVFLNITNGLTYETGDSMVDPGFVQSSWGNFQNGKYLFVNSADHKLVALNTDTMEELVIEDLFGEGAPDSFNLITAASADNSTLAMAMLPPSGEGSDEPFALRGTEIGAPGDVLLLDTTTGDTTWLTIPGDTVQLRSINLSPDGSNIAVELSQGNDRLRSDAIVSLISIDDGTVLGQTKPFQPLMYETVWTDTGLAVQADMDLILLPFDSSDATTLYTLPESNTTLRGLQLTHDPNVVTVIATVCDGECKVAEADNSVVSINVATGETQEFEGVNLAYVSWETQVNLLLMTDPTVAQSDTTTYTAIDPVSGETVAVFENMPGTGYTENQRSLIGPHSVWSTSDFNLTVVAVTMSDMIELRSDGTEHSARLLPAPGRWADEGAGNTQATIFLAPNGSLLSAMAQSDEANGRFLLDLTDPNAEWAGSEQDQVSPDGGGYILFVEGVPED